MYKRTNGALQQMINVHKKKRIRKIEKEISLEDLRIIENLKTFPQKAEVPGDKRSTIKHQINTTTGNKKCKPELMVSLTGGKCTIG